MASLSSPRHSSDSSPSGDDDEDDKASNDEFYFRFNTASVIGQRHGRADQITSHDHDHAPLTPNSENKEPVDAQECSNFDNPFISPLIENEEATQVQQGSSHDHSSFVPPSENTEAGQPEEKNKFHASARWSPLFIRTERPEPAETPRDSGNTNSASDASPSTQPIPEPAPTSSSSAFQGANHGPSRPNNIPSLNPSGSGYHHGPIWDPNQGWSPPDPPDIYDIDALRSRKASVAWMGRPENAPPNERVTLAQTNTLVCDIIVHTFRGESIMCGKQYRDNGTLRNHMRAAHPGCIDPAAPKRTETARARAAALAAIRQWVFSRGWRNASYAYEPGRPAKSLCSHYAELFEARARADEHFKELHGQFWHRQAAPHRSRHQFELTYTYEPSTDTEVFDDYDEVALRFFENTADPLPPVPETRCEGAAGFAANGDEADGGEEGEAGNQKCGKGGDTGAGPGNCFNKASSFDREPFGEDDLDEETMRMMREGPTDEAGTT